MQRQFASPKFVNPAEYQSALVLEQAADLIVQLAEPLLLRGEVTAMQRWLHALPEVLMQERAPLVLARIFTEMASGQIATLGADIQLLTATRLTEHGSALPSLPAWMRDSTAALHMIAAILEDADPRIQRELYQLLTAADDQAQTGHHLTRLQHGFAHWANGDVEPARSAFAQAAWAYQRNGDRHGEVLVTSFLAEIAFHEGAIHQAAQLYAAADRLLDRAEDRGTAVAGLPAIGTGILCYEWNELDQAEQLIDQGLKQAVQGGRVDVILSGLHARARLQQAGGDPAGAYATHAEAVQVAGATQTPRLIAYAEAQQAAHCLNQGRHAAALDWARAQRMAIHDEIGFLRELEYLTFARVLAIQGAYDDALYLMERLRALATAAGRIAQVIPALLATALVHQARGDATEACAAVRQALILAEPGGYLRTFVDAGPGLAAALSQACAQLVQAAPSTSSDNIGAYAQRVRAACQAEWRARSGRTTRLKIAPASVAQEHAHSERVTSAPQLRLSPRERDLLDCIVAGMANKEIARQLGLTSGTVKWYLAELYKKLDVRSRTQALARVRDLGLIR